MPFCSFVYKSKFTGSPQGYTHFNINYIILIRSWAFLVAQLIKNTPAMQENRFNSWVGKIPWRRDRLPTPVFLGFLGGSNGKESAIWETWVQSLGWEDPLEEGMATHSSMLACRITMVRGPCELQSMGLQRVGHDWVTKNIRSCSRQYSSRFRD